MGCTDLTLYHLMARNASCFGERIAWTEAESEQAATFQQLKKQVDELAAGLSKAGVAQGDRIAVVGHNSLAFFSIYGAAALLGAIVVPVNWRLSSEEVCYVLDDSDPKVVCADAAFQETVAQWHQASAAKARLFNLQTNAGGFDPLPKVAGAAPDLPADHCTGDALLMIHTAAVGGRPKGAVLSHGNLLFSCQQLAWLLALADDDKHLNLLPLFHVGGLFMAVAAFLAGAENKNMRKFDAHLAARLIAEQQASVFFDFAPILGDIIKAADQHDLSLKNLRRVIGIDSPETIGLYQEKSGGTFYCLYGQTETSAIVTAGAYDRCPGSAGQPLPLTQVAVVDANDRPLGVGETGEIVVRGPLVFNGYWNLSEVNRQVFRNQWHHTGDMGAFDENGFLMYAGRMPEKELIKTGGENVYPAEVEQALCEHPKIAEAVVIGVADAHWGEAIKAICRQEKDANVTEEEIIAFVGDRIARYKKPRHVLFVDDLPTTTTGMVDRPAVKKMYGQADRAQAEK